MNHKSKGEIYNATHPRSNVMRYIRRIVHALLTGKERNLLRLS